MDDVFERLASGYSVRITCFVDMVSAERDESKDLWLLTIKSNAWYVFPGNMHINVPLTIYGRVKDEEYKELESKIVNNSIIKILALVDQDNIREANPLALLEEVLEFGLKNNNFDEYIQSLACKMPDTYEDEVLGVLTYNRYYKEYSTELFWNGDKIVLVLKVESLEELETIKPVAYTLWENQGTWETRMKDYAVKKLLAVKNKYWIEEGENVVTGEEFKKAMKLQQITIEEDGNFSFYYDDGDLFWGHAIDVDGNLSKGPVDASF